jgi:arsenate reductase (glutaredoxin)
MNFDGENRIYPDTQFGIYIENYMKEVIIYHNPRCSKSRQALELIRKKGIEPHVIEYLKNPPDLKALQSMVQKLGGNVREILREGEEEFQTLHLADSSKNEEELFQAIVKHPILLQRPIVVSGDKAVVARPPELVEGLF